MFDRRTGDEGEVGRLQEVDVDAREAVEERARQAPPAPAFLHRVLSRKYPARRICLAVSSKQNVKGLKTSLLADGGHQGHVSKMASLPPFCTIEGPFDAL